MWDQLAAAGPQVCVHICVYRSVTGILYSSHVSPHIFPSLPSVLFRSVTRGGSTQLGDGVSCEAPLALVYMLVFPWAPGDGSSLAAGWGG